MLGEGWIPWSLIIVVAISMSRIIFLTKMTIDGGIDAIMLRLQICL